MSWCFQPHYGLRLHQLLIALNSSLKSKWFEVLSCNLVNVQTPQHSEVLNKCYTTVSYISKGYYGGQVSDKYITESCGYLNKLLLGDGVLALLCGEQCSLQRRNTKFTERKSQLPRKTRILANITIHTESDWISETEIPNFECNNSPALWVYTI